MSKGKQLFEDYMDKLKVCYREFMSGSEGWYHAMLDMMEAKERLETYLDPPRDENGHWLSQQDTRSTQKRKQRPRKNATPEDS